MTVPLGRGAIERSPSKILLHCQLLTFAFTCLHAGEIANLTWDMVLGPTGAVEPVLELHDSAAKNWLRGLRTGRRSGCPRIRKVGTLY